MSEITITPRQKKLLAALHLDRGADFSSIARRSGVKTHIARYETSRLEARSIARPSVLIDPFRLGLLQYQVYLAIGFDKKEARDRFIRFLENSSQIIWYAHLGGSTQYGFTLCVRTQTEVPIFFEKLIKESGILIVLKRIAQITLFALFQKSYLSPTANSPRTAIYMNAGDTVEISSEERKALAAALESPQLSLAERAKRSGSARSSMALRLERLKEKKVFLREIYLISARRMGFQTFRFLISLKGFREQIEKRFLRFCEVNANIVSLSACIGSWDYELTVEAEKNEGIVNVSERLMAEFTDNIQQLEVLPVFLQAQPSRPLVQLVQKVS